MLPVAYVSGIATSADWSYLSRSLLTDETSSLLVGGPSQRQAQAPDVGVRRGAIVATLVLNLADLNHFDREASSAQTEEEKSRVFRVGRRGGRQQVNAIVKVVGWRRKGWTRGWTLDL